MNTPQPVVMPQGPGGLQWNLGIPDLGGSAYTNMANNLTKSLNEGTANLSQTLKAASGTGQMLQVIGNMKGPDGKPMIDPETMTDIAGKGLGAQQKFLGMAMPSIMQQQQLQNETTAQQRMLNMFQQNPNLLKTKLMMSTTPGQRPPMQQGQVNVGPLTQDSTTATSQQAPTFQVPQNAALHGYTSQQVQHNGNTVHALLDPSGKMVNVFNPDGSVYNGGQ